MTVATERSSAFELTWSLNTPSGRFEGPELTLEYQVEAFEELYLSDRLWDLTSTNVRRPDPFGVYRFVHNGSLRLVFAQAPRPPNVSPSVLYEPFFSRVARGDTRKVSVPIKLPVDEYSSLARNIDQPTVVETVDKVVFVLGYRTRSSMSSDPTPPTFESPEKAGYIVYDPKLVISTLEVAYLPVKRRTGYMARFALPGEPGPRPAPVPK